MKFLLKNFEMKTISNITFFDCKTQNHAKSKIFCALLPFYNPNFFSIKKPQPNFYFLCKSGIKN